MNTAANDITTWSPNFEAYGITTIVWGTEGLGPPAVANPPSPVGSAFAYTTGSYNGYIVVSANESLRVEEIDIEQGAGFEAIVILLNKGVDVEMEVIDDTTIIPPYIGTIVTLVGPYGTIPMLLVGNKSNEARKREGMKTFTFKSFNAIAGLH